MNNFIKPGDTLTFTAPGGGVVAGAVVRIGTIVGIATSTVAAGLPFELAVKGVFLVAKIAGVAWAEGALIYHDSTANNFGTVVSATTMRAGCAAVAALSGDVVGYVRLSAAPAPLNVI